MAPCLKGRQWWYMKCITGTRHAYVQRTTTYGGCISVTDMHTLLLAMHRSCTRPRSSRCTTAASCAAASWTRTRSILETTFLCTFIDALRIATPYDWFAGRHDVGHVCSQLYYNIITPCWYTSTNSDTTTSPPCCMYAHKQLCYNITALCYVLAKQLYYNVTAL